MIEDVYEPVELYRTFFKDAHARNTSELFEELVKQSGIDERANATTVKELRALEQHVARESASSKWWGILRVAVIVALVASSIFVYMNYLWYWLIVPIVPLSFAIYKLNQLISQVNLRLKDVEQKRDAKLQEAWQQMATLNQLYDWDILSKLLVKTVPRLELDPYFSNARLDELQENFGLDDQFNKGRSIVFVQSGVINGNPFLLVRTLDHWMGTRTYHGSLEISWTEERRNSEGKLETVRRHQTLNASVEKPFPDYENRTFIIYGNEAAPDLSFSRRPSDLSKLDDGFLNNWKKRSAIKKLEKKTRDIGEVNNFTIMANREFDVLFGATDRNHEVQFRLLFTPLAQQEMVKLLKDKEVGYGDDFQFVKNQMINQVEPWHMVATDIDAAPERFRNYELAFARKFFNDFHNNFFKSFYFGIAPLLTIPLYQQHRSHADIYKNTQSSQSCYWEHETIAYHFGEKTFEHPECITRSLLKTKSRTESDNTQTIQVTAYGYKGINRTDYVSVFGGDGHHHNVAVDWVEYDDVKRDSHMVVCEKSNRPGTVDAAKSVTEDDLWEKVFNKRGVELNDVFQRRSIAAAVIPKN